ncbi:MAG: hypothetical protein ACTH0V_00700 [Microbacteriaceae bacterium]
MPAVVLPTDAEFSIPVDDFGEPLPYCWLDARQAVFSSSLSEIVAELVPGYAEALEAGDDDALLELRLESLAMLALMRQEALVAEVTASLAEEDADYPGLPEEVLTVLLTPKDGPVIELDEWAPPLPLYLLATQYQPYTDVPAPTGEHVHLLYPHDERGFLVALAELGEGSFRAVG